jgi:hypothetical protein
MVKPVYELAVPTGQNQATWHAGIAGAAARQAAVVKPVYELAVPTGQNALTKQIADHAAREAALRKWGPSRFPTGRAAAAIDIDAVSDAIEATSSKPDSVAAPPAKDRQGLSRQEIALYVAVVVFQIVYFSGAAMLRHDPGARSASQIDGPNPFDAAMYLAVLTYQMVLKYGRK